MTSGAPWSVKGIDPKAREIAKDLAHRAGMTLGEWLNQMIFEDGAKPVEGGAAVPRVSALARSPKEGASPPGEDDLGRVLISLEALSTRLDVSETQQAQTSSRFEKALAELRADQAKVAERLQGGGGGSRADTLRALDLALAQLARHIEDGETRGREALLNLRREIGEEVERLSDQMNRKVEDAENRGADAIAQVGAEVTRVASVVEQRLRRADDAQAEALEKLGAEIARITERLSERIAAAERRSAQAIDDVGEQMARVTDRIHQRQERTVSEIGDRMRQSEERTAKLLEEAREKIDRRLGRHGEPEAGVETPTPAEAEPAAPESAPAPGGPATESFARTRWGGSLAVPPPLAPPQTQPGAAEPLFLEPPSMVAPLEAAFAYLDQPVEAEPEPEHHAIEHDQPIDDLMLEHDAGHPDQPHERVMTVAEMLAAASTPPDEEAEPEADTAFDLYAHSPEPEPEGDAPTMLEDSPAAEAALEETQHETISPQEELRPSTRELIAAARAAARVNSDDPGYHPADLTDAEETDSIFSGVGQRRARMSGTMRGVLLTSGAAVSIGLAASGYAWLHPEMVSALKHGAAPKASEAAKPIPVGPASAPSAAAPVSAPQAMNLTTAIPQAAPAPAPEEPDVAALYREASAKVDMGDATGVAPLRNAANLGYAPAQRRLGKLYEDGGAGVKKDEVEGRRWTQRAAANGDARAMHNLGLDYYEGAGGLKNMAVAAQWFERAAELGLRDSQYNLARFYESGLGVKQDPALAYKWYLIAGRAGDTEAAARGEALKSQLTAETRASIEKSAIAFRPDPAAPPASAVAGLKNATPQQLALAQRALAKLGYYQGASDGAPSQSLGEAIQAYQRDRGMAANGTLSPDLVQSLANITR